MNEPSLAKLIILQTVFSANVANFQIKTFSTTIKSKSSTNTIFKQINQYFSCERLIKLNVELINFI